MDSEEEILTNEENDEDEYEDADEDEDESEEDEEEGHFLDNLLTAEGFCMMSLAVIVDVAEIILDIFVVTALVSLILDIAAILIIGGWMFLRSGEIAVPKRTVEKAKGTIKTTVKGTKWTKRLKWLRPVLAVFELIPFLSIVPCWIVVVYFDLKYGSPIA